MRSVLVHVQFLLQKIFSNRILQPLQVMTLVLFKRVEKNLHVCIFYHHTLIKKLQSCLYILQYMNCELKLLIKSNLLLKNVKSKPKCLKFLDKQQIYLTSLIIT